jgi:single-stranded DNA-binding protein
MIKGVVGAARVRGLRVCVYGPLAELVYGHVQKGSRLGVIGHIQQRTTHKGSLVFEIVAEEVEFLRNIDWEAGERARRDLVQRGLLREASKEQDLSGVGVMDALESESVLPEHLSAAIPEDVLHEN